MLEVLCDAKAVNKKLLSIRGFINDNKILMLFDTDTRTNFIAIEVSKSLGLEVRDCLESTVMLENGRALRSF